MLSGQVIAEGLGKPQDIVRDSAFAGGLGALGYGSGRVASSLLTVETPYGLARQDKDISIEALKLRFEVGKGRPVYRGGTFRKSYAAEGQFWAPELSIEPGYAGRYGAASFT